MFKKFMYFSFIVVACISANFLTGILKAFLDVPTEEFLEAKGYETTTKETPSAGSPLDYSSKDNIAFLAYNVATKDFSSVTSGTVSGSVAGISQSQDVVNKRYVSGNHFLVETSSQGILSFATQKFFNKENNLVLIRDANNPKDLTKGYKEDEPKALSFNGYKNVYGWLPNQLAAYTICDETILDISDLNVIDSNTYQININLDPQYGVYYYRYEVRSNASVLEFPIFSSVNLTVTFTSDWTLKSINSKEYYKNKAPGMSLWVNCFGDLTEEFDFSENRTPIAKDTVDFFSKYQHLIPKDDTGPILKESDGFDYLMQAFSPYLSKPASFDVSFSLDSRKYDYKFYLDLVNNTYGLVGDNLIFFYKDSKPLIRVFNNNIEFIPSDLDLPADDLNLDTLTDSIIDAIMQGEINKVNNLIYVNSTFDLFGIKIPIYFNYIEAKKGIILDELGVDTTLFNSNLKVTFKPSSSDLDSSVVNNLIDYISCNIDYSFNPSSLPNLPNIPLLSYLNVDLDNYFGLFSNLLHTSLDILEHGYFSIDLNFNKDELNLKSNIFVNFINEVYVVINSNIKYKNYSINSEVIYKDGYFYFDTFGKKIKLTLNEIMDFFSLNDMSIGDALTSDLNLNSFFTDINYDSDKLNLCFNLDLLNLKYNLALEKVNDTLVLSSSNLNATLGFDAYNLSLNDKDYLTYSDIKDYKQYVDYALDILKHRYFSIDVIFNIDDLTLTSNIYVSFVDELYAVINSNIKYKNYSIDSQVIYKDGYFYFDALGKKNKLTLNEIMDFFSLNDTLSIEDALTSNLDLNSFFTDINYDSNKLNLCFSLDSLNLKYNLTLEKIDNTLTLSSSNLNATLGFDTHNLSINDNNYLTYKDIKDYKQYVSHALDILKHRYFSIDLNFNKDALSLQSNVYVSFVDDFYVVINTNVKYSNYSIDSSVIYKDGYFYFNTLGKKIKLTLNEILEFLSLNDSLSIEDALSNNLDLSSFFTDINYESNKLNLCLNLNLLNLKYNLALEKIGDTLSLSSSNLNATLGFNTYYLSLNDKDYLTYFDIKDYKQYVDYALENVNLLFYFKDFALSVLSTQETLFDIIYDTNRISLRTTIYLNFFDGLFFSGTTHFVLDDYYYLDLKFYYEKNVFYLQTSNYSFTCTLNEFIDLLNRINDSKFNLNKLCNDLINGELFSYKLTGDNLTLDINLDQFIKGINLNLNLEKSNKDIFVKAFSDQLSIYIHPEVPYRLTKIDKRNVTALDINFVYNVLDLLDDISYYSKKDALSFNFDFSNSDIKFEGFATINFKQKKFRLDLVINDYKNHEISYINLIYNEYFYFTYKTDKNSNKNLSVKFTLQDLKYLINKLVNDLDKDLLQLIGNLPERDTEERYYMDIEYLFKDIFYLENNIIGIRFQEFFTKEHYQIDLKLYKTETPYTKTPAFNGRYGGIYGTIKNNYGNGNFNLNFNIKLSNNNYTYFTPGNYKFYNLKDFLPAIDAAIKTINLRQWRIKGSFSLHISIRAIGVNWIGVDIHPDIQYDIVAKLPKNAKRPTFEATFNIPVALGINNDVKYKFGDVDGGRNRVLKVFYNGDKYIFKREETVTRLGWFKIFRDRFTRLFALNEDQFSRRGVYAFMKYGVGLKDKYVKQIQDSIDQNKYKTIDKADVIKDMYPNHNKSNYTFKFNPSNLLKDSNMTLLNMNLNIYNNLFTGGSAILEINPAKAVYITIESNNFRFVNNGWYQSFSNSYYYHTGTYIECGPVREGRNGYLGQVARIY